MGNFRNRTGRNGFPSAANSRKRHITFSDPALDRDPQQRSWITLRKRSLAEDKLMGFSELLPGARARIGWLVNMAAAIIEEPSSKRPVQAVDLFFISDDGDDFRASIIARPYMYLAVSPHLLREVEIAMRRKFHDVIAEIALVRMEDISLPNHLALDSGRFFLKVEARTTGDLFVIREELRPIIERNMKQVNRSTVPQSNIEVAFSVATNPLEAILDMREYDVAPVNRLAIDKKINVGYWYRVSPGGRQSSESAQESYEEDLLFEQDGPHGISDRDPDLNASLSNDLFSAHLTRLPEIVERASPVVLAYDIECTKKPLKFPDPEAGDIVMMISWMVDGKGYLGINREVVSKDVPDFEYKPHDEFHGAFKVFNVLNEKALLERFFSEVRLAAPRVFVTFNGDFFDWPFVEKRASILGLDMGKEIGMRGNDDDQMTIETKGRTAVHMDVFHWVNRDSYLPQGSRGLKAVTRALLGFEPEEIPPEEMMTAAIERPEEMAKYSVSDAVCTYYLYMKYVHPFIFSLCNIIPLKPDDVLRRGSGTLCESLLMCQAREKKIVAPNKYQGSAVGKLTDDGHVLETETYVGGHVEAIRTGVYRSDLPLDFNIEIDALDDLESTLDETLQFAITVEGKTKMEDVINYDEVRSKILEKLRALREKPRRTEKPLLYHLDVSAMYPNIILTNRLQPHAIVSPAQCAACDFNGMSDCQRDMEWVWRGEFFPASRGEAEMIHRRAAQEERDLERQAVHSSSQCRSSLPWHNIDKISRTSKKTRVKSNSTVVSATESTGITNFQDEGALKSELFRKRLKDYCRSNYRKTQETRITEKTATVCQRENPFYVDTVRAFRDRRYDYKALLKKQKKARSEAKESGDLDALKSADNLVVLYDSLQLAHKCILNSFYGYVMRKAARWYSMEMAGIVTNTGGQIIRRTREFIEKVGLPLELDTDGIWCALPVSFPENFSFRTKSGKKVSMSYICSVFNSDVAANFTNPQYQDLVDPGTYEYEQRSECSILFEVDGPYRAMVLPASLEEGKNIKKRYAVFNEDGSLAELKGFEIKRRGELKLIKHFQGEIFDKFLKGTSVSECYKHVGDTCNKWLDILITKGAGMSDEQLLELLVEQNNMSKPLEDYIEAKQKSCAITCASRLQEFLGADIARDKGLATTYVIAKKPEDVQVTSRAIPVKIFEYKNGVVRRRLLKKWLKSADNDDIQLRKLLDWDYYKGRLANAILKIVSIPAALQAVENPVPRIEYPPWLVKHCRELKDKRKQRKLSSFFKALPEGEKPAKTFYLLQDAGDDTNKLSMEDIEDLPLQSWTAAKIAQRRAKATVSRRRRGKELTAKRAKDFGLHQDELLLRSTAKDPEARAFESRQAMFNLIRQPHPDKRTDYKGWVRYAKRIWRAQRAVRVQRYAVKRKSSDAALDTSDDEEQETLLDSGKVVPFGGDSFACQFGTKKHDWKRRKVDIPTRPDYGPSNFVADLRNAPLREGFFKTKAIPLLGSGVVWQNIAVSPVLNKPGEFLLWALPVRKERGRFVSGQLYSIPLHVKRTLYFNSRLPSGPEIPGVECAFVKGLALPRSREVHHMYRLQLEEARFQETDKDIVSLLSDTGAVDGIFGTQLPLEYETIVALGTLCAPKKSVVSNMTTRNLLTKGIGIEDLIPKGSTAAPYLQDKEDSLHRPFLNQAFVYGSHAVDDSSRALYAVVAPAAKLVHVAVVTANRSTQINLRRIWKHIVDDKKAEDSSHSDTQTGRNERGDPFDMLPSDCEFTVNVVRTREEAWSDIQLALSNLRDGSSLAAKSRSTGLKTLLLAQWPALDTAMASKAMFGSNEKKSALHSEFSALEECVPATRNYPVVRIASNAEDGNYMPVGWEPKAASNAMARFTDVSNWLSSQLLMSRFAGIPIGNVSSTDVHSQALDVLVGRELMNRDHVLWASPLPQPDLGGREEDDCNLQNEVLSVPEVTAPGSYRTVCVDTELSNLSIATILSSSHVNQLEGTDLAFDVTASVAAKSAYSSRPEAHLVRNPAERTAGGKILGPLDEMASSAPAFQILKDLVSTWEKIATSDGAPEIAAVARGLLDHLNRWVRSESSLLYDPALARFIGWIVTKVFQQLIAELKSLGATIVYASVSRLVLATPKTHTVDGLRYAGFLEKTVKEKPLFRHIHFQPLLGVYSGLLFVDRFNFGALPSPEEAMILRGELERASAPHPGPIRAYASQQIPHVRMVWDMVRYLPIPVAVLWSQVVEEFIRRPLVQRLRNEEEEDDVAAEEISELTERNPSTSEALEDAQRRRKRRQLRPRGDGFANEVKMLACSLTGQLLEKVHEIREKTPTLVFPNVPSVHSTFKARRRNPALEFVRSLCHVLGLDIVSTEEVACMKRSLLQLLGAREFAKESQFVDPSLPVPLNDVICTCCNAVVDLDIARDARLWTGLASENSDCEKGVVQMTWACEYCGNPYDTRQIELNLTRVAQKLYISYQVQDLICKKCNMVKRENMTDYCPCNGARFEISVTHSCFRKQILALKSVAEFHRFEFLLETVSWMSSCMSSIAHRGTWS